MQAQADLAQIPVDVYPSAHATPLGAAACARLALEPTTDIASVVGGWTAERTYEPQWSADRAADLSRRVATRRPRRPRPHRGAELADRSTGRTTSP